MRACLAEFYRQSVPGIGHIANAFGFRKPTILCLHSVERDDDQGRMNGSMAVTDRFLGDLIDHVRSRGLEILSLDDAITRLDQRDFRPFLCLTFDDGYRDNYEVAFPVLRRHGAPAAIFLATGLIDRTSPMWWHPLERAFAGPGAAGTFRSRAERAGAWAEWTARFRASEGAETIRLMDELACRHPEFHPADAFDGALDATMIREMAASGLVTFGAHTVTHPLLARLSGPSLAREIEGARDRCAALLGEAPRYFAYPFGQPDEVGPEAPAAVARAGFAAAFTTTAATLKERNTGDRYRLPRIMLTRRSQNLASIDAYVSGLTEAIKGV
jgi:peptidoglycan/xylan/chitin deacetylase (PgdA/CDA1 family)